MRTTTSTVLVILLVAACGDGRHDRPEPSLTGKAPRIVFGLSSLADGALPDGFTVSSGTWIGAAAPDGTRGLLQDGKGTGPDFNVVLAGDPALFDLVITVTVHPVSGEIDQGGGPVWRARDGKNYYVARWNPLEDNFRAYKVVDGVRSQLASAHAPGGTEPRKIRIRMIGSTIEGFLDGKPLFTTTDGTFPGPGRLGLWTKADARTVFTGMAARNLSGGEGPGD